MGFGFRKSINLGSGFRLNVSKSGIGLSAGIKGFRVGVGPSGTRMRASIPGTGIYYESRLASGRERTLRSKKPPADNFLPDDRAPKQEIKLGFLQKRFLPPAELAFVS